MELVDVLRWLVEIVETGDGPVARLAYDEGGEGWWPLDCLVAEGE